MAIRRFYDLPVEREEVCRSDAVVCDPLSYSRPVVVSKTSSKLPLVASPDISISFK
jgi:hypothetical protein